jgi:hypothetical protein
VTPDLRSYSGCRFPFRMSNSHFKCPPDVHSWTRKWELLSVPISDVQFPFQMSTRRAWPDKCTKPCHGPSRPQVSSERLMMFENSQARCHRCPATRFGVLAAGNSAVSDIVNPVDMLRATANGDDQAVRLDNNPH